MRDIQQERHGVVVQLRHPAGQRIDRIGNPCGGEFDLCQRAIGDQTDRTGSHGDTERHTLDASYAGIACCQRERVEGAGDGRGRISNLHRTCFAGGVRIISVADRRRCRPGTCPRTDLQADIDADAIGRSILVSGGPCGAVDRLGGRSRD